MKVRKILAMIRRKGKEGIDKNLKCVQNKSGKEGKKRK